MENLSEFRNSTPPEKNTSSLISYAFDMYKGVFWFAMITMAVYIAGTILLESIFSFDSQALYKEIMEAGDDFKTQDLLEVEGVLTYYAFSGIFGWLAAPLFVGLIYVTSRFNNNKPLRFNDLFIGYRQNFLNIFLYTIISSILVGIAFALCFLPGLFVAPLFLLGYPILLFENANAIQAIKKSFSIAKDNYGTFLATTLLGGLIAIAGVIFCGVGILLTMPFIYVVMYSAYSGYLGKPRELVEN